MNNRKNKIERTLKSSGRAADASFQSSFELVPPPCNTGGFENKSKLTEIGDFFLFIHKQQQVVEVNSTLNSIDEAVKAREEVIQNRMANFGETYEQASHVYDSLTMQFAVLSINRLLKRFK